MTKKDIIYLEDLIYNIKRIRIKLDSSYLKELLIKASKNNRPHCDMNFIKSLGLKPTTKYLNCTIYGWMKNDIALPINYMLKIAKLAGENWKKIQEKIIMIKSGENGLEIENIFPIKIDQKLGSIIGHIMGDGSIDKKYQQVFFSNSEKTLLNEFSTNIEEIFGLKPRIWMQKKPEYGNTQWDKKLESIQEMKSGRNVGLFYPTICGLILNAIFDNFAVGKDKKMTKEIITANRQFKKGLIRAFYDDESSVGQKNIRLFQDRKEVLETFRELLKEFYISSSTIKMYKKRDKERYYFDIFRKSNFIKFDREIGFTSPRKDDRLKKMLIIKNPTNSR